MGMSQQPGKCGEPANKLKRAWREPVALTRMGGR